MIGYDIKFLKEEIGKYSDSFILYLIFCYFVCLSLVLLFYFCVTKLSLTLLIEKIHAKDEPLILIDNWDNALVVHFIRERTYIFFQLIFT